MELFCARVGAQAVTGYRSQDGLSVMGFHASGHRKVTGCSVGLGLRDVGGSLNSFIHIPLNPQQDSHQGHQPLLGAVERETREEIKPGFDFL